MNTDIETTLLTATIGKSPVIKLEDAEQNRLAGRELVKQARYTLDIVSRDLDHKLYDNDDFVSAVKELATSGPKAKIRILIQDSDKTIKQGHRIIDLARKLTSFIEIRIQGKRFKEFNEAWLIVDNKAWIRRAYADKYPADIDYSATRELKDVAKSFDSMWYEASNDPNFRQLSI